MKRKTINRWVKQEKRIIRALYRAGMLNSFLQDWRGRPQEPKDTFYWESYKRLHRGPYPLSRLLIPTGERMSFRAAKHPYIPEVFVALQDYYGDADEKGLCDIAHYFDLCDCPMPPDFDDPFPRCHHRRAIEKSRDSLVRFLERLPVARNDHKINRVLRTRKED